MPAAQIKTEAFLSSLPLFKELGEDEIARLAAGTQPVRAERGEMLFHRGDAVLGFHAIVYGQVKLFFTSPRGDEKVVDIVSQGQTFGEAVMFLERPHVVSAQALADSMLLYIGRQALFTELERDPQFARRIIGGMARRLRQLMGDVENYSLNSGTQRVIGYLLRDSEGDEGAGVPLEVRLPATKGVIASRLNLTQEHFSRILHELAGRSLIEVRGRDILIPDVAALRMSSD